MRDGRLSNQGSELLRGWVKLPYAVKAQQRLTAAFLRRQLKLRTLTVVVDSLYSVGSSPITSDQRSAFVIEPACGYPALRAGPHFDLTLSYQRAIRRPLFEIDCA